MDHTAWTPHFVRPLVPVSFPPLKGQPSLNSICYLFLFFIRAFETTLHFDSFRSRTPNTADTGSFYQSLSLREFELFSFKARNIPYYSRNYPKEPEHHIGLGGSMRKRRPEKMTKKGIDTSN
jgi:hypothetical protein